MNKINTASITKNIKSTMLVILLGVFLASGITFAVWAPNTWHGTDWIQDGKINKCTKYCREF